MGCHAPGAIPKAPSSTPESELAEKGDSCTLDADCAGDKLVCEVDRCVPWTRMKGEVPEVEPEQLAAMIEAGELQILDVRTGAEWRSSRIEGAVHVPISQLTDRLLADELGLDPEIPVVTICLTAHRSIPATRLLRRNGYDAVQLAGGMSAWRKAKMPRVKGKPKPKPEPE